VGPEQRATGIGLVTGAVAGLAAITPASGYVPSRAALVIGLAAGALCDGAVQLKEPFHYDDALDVSWLLRYHPALGEMQLNPKITRPAAFETLEANQIYLVRGIAWAGEIKVTPVEVSADGGRSWASAQLVDPAQRYTWRRWAFEWRTPADPSRYTLMSRAKDEVGSLQPQAHDQNFGQYVLNHLLPTDAAVVKSRLGSTW
jgi:Ammonium Transporter Family/Mo-co oxidoreductase dimerisation domain